MLLALLQTFSLLELYVPELLVLVFTCSHGNRFCESTFQLIFQRTPRCTNWSRLTYFDSAWQQKAAGQAVRHRGRLMLDNIGVSLLIYIVLFSQSSERLVFCERNRIPRTETSHCSHSQTPCVPCVDPTSATQCFSTTILLKSQNNVRTTILYVVFEIFKAATCYVYVMLCFNCQSNMSKQANKLLFTAFGPTASARKSVLLPGPNGINSVTLVTRVKLIFQC